MSKTLTQKMKSKGVNTKKKTEPVWSGPESDTDNGGITFSLLSRFLTCRERFRLRVVDGLKPVQRFDHKPEYGNMWHACEESFAGGEQGWEEHLKAYTKQLLTKYPTQQEQIVHWMNVCKTQFPIYIKWWEKHPDIKSRTPLLQEQVFRVPYILPSGRIVQLRGKWDSIDLVGKGAKAGIWLMENKTKGDVDSLNIERQLSFDLQTMLYVCALEIHKTEYMEDAPPDPGYAKEWDNPITGVRYNVIRRPLSGGVGSIKQKKANKSNPQGESSEEFYARLGEIIENCHGGTEEGQEQGLQKGQHHFFMRWNVEITGADIQKFKHECLEPILENLCWWWDEIAGNETDYSPPNSNWRHPFGCVNTIDEYGASDIDEYLKTGSEVGLVRNAPLFEELQ